ncbi:MAG: hypothetical protein FD180_4520 [Planctomycetota bacterium]|nr:MAG: hypothetical protein FD180_4520 [Planctomycetota bacterium]
MKRIAAMRSACLAAAGLVAAGAFAYGVAFVVWAPVKPVRDYEAEKDRIQRPPTVAKPPYERWQVASVWEWQRVKPTPPPPFSLDATLAGTITSPDPAKSSAAVNGPTGQTVLRHGDRFQGTRVIDLDMGRAIFDYGDDTIPLTIRRSTEK